MLRLLLSFACGSAVAVGDIALQPLQAGGYPSRRRLTRSQSVLRSQSMELRQESGQAQHRRDVMKAEEKAQKKAAKKAEEMAAKKAEGKAAKKKAAAEEKAAMRRREEEDERRSTQPPLIETKGAWRTRQRAHRELKPAYDEARAATKDLNAATRRKEAAKKAAEDAEKAFSKAAKKKRRVAGREARNAATQAAEEARAAEEHFTAVSLRYHEAMEKKKSVNVKVMLAENEEDIARIIRRGGMPDRSTYNWSEAELLEMYDEHVANGNYGENGYLYLPTPRHVTGPRYGSHWPSLPPFKA